MASDHAPPPKEDSQETPKNPITQSPASDSLPPPINPLFVVQPSPFVSATPENVKSSAGASDGKNVTQVHVQALDEIVSVNSFFTVAVFIGLSLMNPTTDANLVGACFVGANYTKFLFIFEVVSFSSYLFSSLIAQGLKLAIVMLNSKDHLEVLSCKMNPIVLRFGMLVTAVGTTIGTVFLTLSIVFFVQIRLGLLSCETVWSKWAAIPMVIMVSSGLFTFLFSAMYAFRT